MSVRDGPYPIILFFGKLLRDTIATMDHAPRLTGGVDRVIHVTLTEADWQAFMASTPQPVDWLKERIQEAIVKSQQPAAGSRQS
jgi:hypothetical protein